MNLWTRIVGIMSPDPDTRRLIWLLQRPKLRVEHRTTLQVIRIRAMHLRKRFVRGDRETIRVLFNLYSGRNVKVA